MRSHRARPSRSALRHRSGHPRREDLKRITSRRLGAEITFNRAWSAAADLMLWCFTQVGQHTKGGSDDQPISFQERRNGLRVGKAFVFGHAKEATYRDDGYVGLG